MKYLYIVLLNFFFNSCVSIPKEYVANDTLCHYNDLLFKITKEELTLNPNIQKQLQNKKGDFVITDNQSYKNEYLDLGDSDITNIKINKDLNISKWIRYKSNKAKWIFFKYENGKSKIFKETHYDEQGNIIKVIDYEKGYNICWAEAIEIVKKIAKKDIEKYQITEFWALHNNLNEFPNEKPVWYVGLTKGNEKYEENKNGMLRFRIDGITGKVLKKYRIKNGF